MSWWSELWGDRSDPYNDYANRSGQIGQQYDPYINQGQQAGNMSWEQYQRLINNPNQVQDQVAAGFSMSPYQNYMQDMVQKRMNYNSANTGMLGSGAANRAMQQELTNMTGQFQNDYINRGMQSYGLGLGGLPGLSQRGFEGMGEKANWQEQEAAARLKGELSKSQGQTNMWGRIIGGLGGAAAGFLSGGWGGAASGAMQGAGMGGQNVQGNPRASTADVYNSGPGGGYGVYDPRRYG